MALTVGSNAIFSPSRRDGATGPALPGSTASMPAARKSMSLTNALLSASFYTSQKIQNKKYTGTKRQRLVTDDDDKDDVMLLYNSIN